MANARSCPLPQGIYAVDIRFLDMEQGQPVEVSFRGVDYTATVGVNAFAMLDAMSQAAEAVPDAPFCGQTFDMPVAIIPAGSHECPRIRAYLPIKLQRGIAILGEAVGIVPNDPQNITKPNPERNVSESVLTGSLYWGRLFLVEGAPGKLLLDGLTLDGYRVCDGRSTGVDMGIEVRNCIINGAHHDNVVDGHPFADTESSRTIYVHDCRCDGFDSMEGRGRFVNGQATELVLERIYYANTREFFGMVDYGRTEYNAIPGLPAKYTLRDCYLYNYNGIRGMNFKLPEGVRDVEITIENCTFRNFADPEIPAVYAAMPDEGCSLTIRNTTFSSDRGAKVALMLEAPETAKVTLENVTLEGTAQLLTYKSARRTEGPAYIGQVVWGDELLDDPHPPCTDEETVNIALTQLEAIYGNRKALHGDMHCHSNSGGTSDGKTPLAEFVRQLRALGLDFAAIVDHRQIRHCLLPEWDADMLICGTEPGHMLKDESRPMRSRKMDYCMLFQHPTDYFRVMDAFPEFDFTGGPDGHNGYPSLTPDRVAELSRFIYSLGGLMVHAHPKQLMASDEPLHYYFGEYMPLETIVGNANSFDTVQNRNLWESLLKLGKRISTHGMSDSHAEAKNCALTTVYARERKGAAVLREVREGDCAAGCIGVKMAICGARMGSSLPYREGLQLAIELDDYYRPGMKDDTVYCLKVFTDQGLAYASEFDGKEPQKLVIPVQKRKYYRVEVTNESDECFVTIANPIWLDDQL